MEDLSLLRSSHSIFGGGVKVNGEIFREGVEVD